MNDAMAADNAACSARRTLFDEPGPAPYYPVFDCELVPSAPKPGPEPESESHGKTESEKIAECGQKYTFYYCEKCEISYTVKHTCRSRFCPTCAKTRAGAIYKDWLDVQFRWPVHLVLTLGLWPEANLKEGVDLALKAFAKLRRKFRQLRYGLYTLEFCPRPNQVWYVHLHCLAECKWLNHDKLSAAWLELTGFEVVWIKRVSVGRDNRQAAIREVVKYVTKGLATLPAERIDALARFLAHRRLVATFGRVKRPSLVQTQETSLRCPHCGALVHWAGTCLASQLPALLDPGKVELWRPGPSPGPSS